MSGLINNVGHIQHHSRKILCSRFDKCWLKIVTHSVALIALLSCLPALADGSIPDVGLLLLLSVRSIGLCITLLALLIVTVAWQSVFASKFLLTSGVVNIVLATCAVIEVPLHDVMKECSQHVLNGIWDVIEFALPQMMAGTAMVVFAVTRLWILRRPSRDADLPQPP